MTTAWFRPFGADAEVRGALPQQHKYTDQEQDDTGLYYYGARYYDAGLGRFMSADTILPNVYDTQLLNRFTYVKNNPLVLIDPTGHNPLYYLYKLTETSARAALAGLVGGASVGAGTGIRYEEYGISTGEGPGVADVGAAAYAFKQEIEGIRQLQLWFQSLSQHPWPSGPTMVSKPTQEEPLRPQKKLTEVFDGIGFTPTVAVGFAQIVLGKRPEYIGLIRRSPDSGGVFSADMPTWPAAFEYPRSGESLVRAWFVSESSLAPNQLDILSSELVDTEKYSFGLVAEPDAVHVLSFFPRGQAPRFFEPYTSTSKPPEGMALYRAVVQESLN